ncbi:MAG: hypothetical protein KBS60_00280, partial [Phascolarctobacterium sp.]|nr:hypothetical protein [Candidatus Phascolarctobacterium caballi]
NESKGNKITITGSTSTGNPTLTALQNDGVGNASGNSVSVTGIAATKTTAEKRVNLGSVYAVINGDGTAKSNTVTLDKVNIAGEIYGAENTVKGDITSNTVTIKNSSITGAITGGKTTGSGIATSNVITLTNSVFEGNITAAYTGATGSTTNAKGQTIINESKGNKITITGSTSTGSPTLTALQNEGVGNASGNSVSVTGIAANAKQGIVEQRVNLNNVYAVINGDGTAKSNTVTLDKVNIAGDVYAVQNNNGEVSANKVTISNANVGQNIYGGYTETGNTFKNIVILTNVEVGDSVYGGYTGYGNATGNTVTIAKGIVSGNVFGGVTLNGIASGNIVNINAGSHITGIVVGGYSESGDVTGNRVNIAAGAVVDGEVYGGYACDGAVSKNYVYVSGKAKSDNAKYFAEISNASSLLTRNDLNSDTEIKYSDYYDGGNIYLANGVTLTLNNDGTDDNWEVSFKIQQDKDAIDSTLILKSSDTYGFEFCEDDDNGKNLRNSVNVTNLVVDICFLNIESNCIGENLKNIEISEYGVVRIHDINLNKILKLSIVDTGDYTGGQNGVLRIEGVENSQDYSLTLSEDKDGSGNYLYTIGENVQIELEQDVEVSDPTIVTDRGRLTVNADQLKGTLDIKNAGDLIFTGGTLTHNIVGGTQRVTDDDSIVDRNEDVLGRVIVTDSLTVGQGVKVGQTIYGNNDSNNTLVLTLKENSQVNQIVGGMAEDGNVNNNNLTIAGSGTVKIDNGGVKIEEGGYSVTGGYSETGEANNNIVTIKGCTFASDIFGATGINATGNKVIVENGNFTD